MSKLTDEEIEAAFKKCGGRWNGDHWAIEDADLHPLFRHIERLTIERCAEVCDAADKSTHPADLADALRALLGE